MIIIIIIIICAVSENRVKYHEMLGRSLSMSYSISLLETFFLLYVPSFASSVCLHRFLFSFLFYSFYITVLILLLEINIFNIFNNQTITIHWKIMPYKYLTSTYVVSLARNKKDYKSYNRLSSFSNTDSGTKLMYVIIVLALLTYFALILNYITCTILVIAN